MSFSFPKQIEYNENEPLTLFIQKLKNEGIIKNADIFKMIFETEEECRKIKVFAVDKNEENFDKLEIELRKMNL